MADYISFQAVRESEYELLFDDTLKLATSSPYTKEFDLKGCKAIIVNQKSTHVSSPARTGVSAVGLWAYAPVIDDNLNSATTHAHVVGSLSGSGTYSEVIIDFGSIAVRTLSTKGRGSMACNSSGSGSRYVTVNVSYSEDDVSYSGGGVVVTALGAQSGGQDITATRTDVGVSMRYAKIYSGGSSDNTCNGNASAYECWVPGQSLGTAAMTFEVYNELTSVWETIDLGISLPAVNSDTGSDTQTKTGVSEAAVSRNWPNGPGRIRAKYVITDGCNAKAGVVKIFD